MTHLDLIPFRLLIDGIVVPARRHFRETFLPVAVPLAVANLLLAVVQLIWFRGLSSTDPDAFGAFFGGCFAFMLLALLIMAGYGLSFSALTVGAMQAVAGSPRVSMLRAWGFVLRPPVLGTLILVGVASFLSMMMCYVPALYVVPLLSFALPVMADEGRFGLDAFRRCAELAHFNRSGRWTATPWFQMLVFLFVGMMLSYAVTAAVQLPIFIVQQVYMLREAAAGEMTDPATVIAETFWLQIPTIILNAMATAAVWLYWAFGTCLIFKEVRRRKEADDLQEAIDEMTGRTPDRPAVPAAWAIESP